MTCVIQVSNRVLVIQRNMCIVVTVLADHLEMSAAARVLSRNRFSIVQFYLHLQATSL